MRDTLTEEMALTLSWRIKKTKVQKAVRVPWQKEQCVRRMQNKQTKRITFKEVWKIPFTLSTAYQDWKYWKLESLEPSRHQMLRPSPELNHKVNVQAHSQINSQACGCYLTHLLIGITREAKGIARVWALYTLEQLSQNLRMRNLGSGDSHLSPGPRATDLVTPTRVRC